MRAYNILTSGFFYARRCSPSEHRLTFPKLAVGKDVGIFLLIRQFLGRPGGLVVPRVPKGYSRGRYCPGC